MKSIPPFLLLPLILFILLFQWLLVLEEHAPVVAPPACGQEAKPATKTTPGPVTKETPVQLNAAKTDRR